MLHNAGQQRDGESETNKQTARSDFLRLATLLALLCCRGQELGLDERHDTTLRDDNVAEELLEPGGESGQVWNTRDGIRDALLIVADGKLQVTGHNTLLLVVAGSVAGELKDLSREVLEDGGEVD
jgi:hypothetical protein